jgi:hypothetical protein
MHVLPRLKVLHLPAFGLCLENPVVLGIPIDDALNACFVVHIDDLLLG